MTHQLQIVNPAYETNYQAYTSAKADYSLAVEAEAYGHGTAFDTYSAKCKLDSAESLFNSTPHFL